jgi:signal peptidase I
LIKRILLILVLSLGGAWIVRGFLFEGVWVASGSMEPTLQVGAHYFVNKFAYRLHAPLRGDIIVFRSPVDEQKGLIKRVIAIGGDQVQLRNKQVFLNGQALSEPYAVYDRASEHLIGDNTPPLSVPEHCFFVLGDNRDESEDSSMWKDPATGEAVRFIHARNIQGRLIIP